MRPLSCTLLLLSLAALPLGAQVPAAGSRWTLRLAVSRDAFTGASADTSTLSGTRVEVVPTPRLAVEVGIGRRVGPWEVGISGGYAGGGLRAATDALFLDERTGGVDRYRASLMIRRELARLQAAALLVGAGGLLDHWRVSELGDHTTLGLRGGVILAIPLSGSLALENTALVAVGGGPFRKADLPPDAEIKTMWTWSLGVALRLRP